MMPNIGCCQESSNFKETGGPSSSVQLPVTVNLTESQRVAAIVKVAPAIEGPFSSSISLTGKVSLNEEKLAHIYPNVSGQVGAVKVALGDTVAEGDVLVIVNSREVGAAKLDLFQAKLQLELARLKLNLQAEIASNTKELLVALTKKMDITELQEQFTGRSMGDYRERLLQAYAVYVKSEADVQRLINVADSGAISSKQLLYAKASRNADSATFYARLEQIDYELSTSQLQASQLVKEAETRVAIATTNLRIMGCELRDFENFDPLQQGEAVSDYFIRAPLSGTVISKDVVWREQVRPDSQIMAIADLSTVWIEANVYEKDARLLESLKDRSVSVRNAAWPERDFPAKVFFTGEIMDEKTRTISMRAVANNAHHLLKPGMFVTISFASQSNDKPVIQVPSGAVLEHAGSQFVFVKLNDSTFERRDVEVGENNGSSTVIHRGIAKSDMVVTTGGFVLKSKMLESLMGDE
ncbi:MAG: efflux RND transporter periplasmic adaptor subunit [Pirellulaceae bacterium]|nr:efflux RND transporter periplasmic adaptor subunit [Pirellulaceae bacterium]